MNPPRVDPRISRTIKKLSDSLFALLIETPLSKISVEKILDAANVTRATFYSHFKNKNDFVQRAFDSIFVEFLEHSLIPADASFKESFDVQPNTPLMRLNLERAFNFVKNNKDAFNALLLNPEFHLLKDQFANSLGDNMKLFNQMLGGRLTDAIRTEEVQQIIILSPFVAIIEKWLSNNMTEDPSYMAKLFSVSLHIGGGQYQDLTAFFDTDIAKK